MVYECDPPRATFHTEPAPESFPHPQRKESGEVVNNYRFVIRHRVDLGLLKYLGEKAAQQLAEADRKAKRHHRLTAIAQRDEFVRDDKDIEQAGQDASDAKQEALAFRDRFLNLKQAWIDAGKPYSNEQSPPLLFPNERKAHIYAQSVEFPE